MGMPAPEVVNVRRAGLLHDLGKLGVPNTILDKPGRLDASEMEVIRRHPELTLRILDTIPTFARCRRARRLPPRAARRHAATSAGMTAPELALGARIVAVADVFEAMTADRPYRAAMPVAQALGIMRESAGEHLAADVIEALADTVA